ncbi:sensor histidine kinase [Microbacterium sp. NPDC055910]|uniref:sensor histidine kinase n=1 Tax=Microbacterium sp. NPDC055910 TaxID=3345659 RepID=UPI0035E39357
MFRRLKPYQIVVDATAALVFFAVALPIELATAAGTELYPSGDVLGALAFVVPFTVAAALSRLAPGLALAIAWLAAVIQMALGRPPTFADLAVFVVLFAAAAYGSNRVYWIGLASAFVGAVVITVYLLAGPLVVGGAITWQAIPLALAILIAAAFALGLAWTIGALVRSARRARANREAQKRAEAEAVVEQERVRIARDMHDVVAHSLAVVIAQADGARYAAAADPSAATTALGTISTTARSALSDVRMLLTQLRHSQSVGPQPTLADLEQLYAQVRAAGVELRVAVDPVPPGEPPAAVQLAVYRILQEALTNALRHGAGVVSVGLAWHPDRVDLAVRNPLKPGDRPAGTGHGLIGMGERAHLIGGRFDAAPHGAEFVVTATLPIRQEGSR